jgi:hypothetical protein
VEIWNKKQSVVCGGKLQEEKALPRKSNLRFCAVPSSCFDVNNSEYFLLFVVKGKINNIALALNWSVFGTYTHTYIAGLS